MQGSTARQFELSRTFAELVESAVVLRDVVFLEIFDGLGIFHPPKRLLRRLEGRVQFLYQGGVACRKWKGKEL